MERRMGEVYAVGEGFLGHGYGSDRVEANSRAHAPQCYSILGGQAQFSSVKVESQMAIHLPKQASVSCNLFISLRPSGKRIYVPRP